MFLLIHEGKHRNLASCIARLAVNPRPASVKRMPAEVPVFHAVARNATAARRVCWSKSRWVLRATLRPTFLDFGIFCAFQQIVNHVVHLRGHQVFDELESQGVEHSGSLGCALGLLVRLVLLRLASLGVTLPLFLLQLLTVALLPLPLLLRPAALHGHPEGVQIVGQALVRLPGSSAECLAPVLHVAVIRLVVRGSPLDHVEVLVYPALGVQEGLPGRQVFSQGLDAVPAFSDLTLCWLALVLQLPSVPCGLAAGPAELRAGARKAHELLLDVQECAQVAMLELCTLGLQNACQLVGQPRNLGLYLGDSVQDEQPLVPQ
mmetsp:Transcript_43912/g.122129  ORF Transcript_43912/g.122129 Transcript_43912/m.122129 type:complete len:319 (-) Transcript_43912:415-1371(-)